MIRGTRTRNAGSIEKQVLEKREGREKKGKFFFFFFLQCLLGSALERNLANEKAFKSKSDSSDAALALIIFAWIF